MVKRLLVVDGADLGRFFLLPESGAVTVGTSNKHADICLHDLHVARVHCQVEVDGERIVVSDLEDSGGTLVNGQKISEQELNLGDTLRVGNSHLRLESAEGPTAAARGPGQLPHLAPDQLDQLAGHTLAHFEIEQVLGQGFYGSVFRARDVKNDRVVSLKVLSPEFPKNDAEMQCFTRAVKAALPVRHPHLVLLYTAGRTGPYCWIAREYVDGRGLNQVIQNFGTGPDWKVGLRVAVHVGRALECMHQHHLVHGNITPQNILVQGSDHTAKLGDLMFRQAVDGSVLQGQVLERKFLAELPYLSPEQADPGAYIDDLCDQHALGAVLYALLTGRPPVSGDSPAEILDAVRTAMPENPKTYQRSIPDSLQRAVLRMLAKHQEERYSSPAELLADLERIATKHGVAV